MRAAKYVFLGLLLIGLVELPQLFPNPYYVHLVIVIAIYAILLFGLDIVVGYTGEISLGHAGLFGIGAYSTGVLAVKLGAPFWLALPGSIAITTLCGAILALPALRVTGPYLAMVTLAFGTIVQIFINELVDVTNGAQGLSVLKPVILGRQLNTIDFYYLVLAITVLALLVVNRMLKSHIGRALEALRASTVASDCLGVSVYKNKVLAFMFSAAFAGLAGGLYTYSEEYIAPNNFNFELTILFLLAVTLGGRKTRSGAILGALIVVMLPNLLSDIELFRTLTTVVVCDGSAIARLPDLLPEEMSSVDVLINNAGLALGAEPAYIGNLDDWMRMIDTNCRGLVQVTRAFLPGMVKRNSGHVINLGSVAGNWPYRGGNVYGATKAFVHQFSLNLRTDLAETAVRVTDVAPGLCGGTEFSNVRYGGDQARVENLYKDVQPLTAADIAETIYWVATRPAHVNINFIELMPVAQTPGGLSVFRG